MGKWRSTCKKLLTAKVKIIPINSSKLTKMQTEQPISNCCNFPCTTEINLGQCFWQTEGNMFYKWNPIFHMHKCWLICIVSQLFLIIFRVPVCSSFPFKWTQETSNAGIMRKTQSQNSAGQAASRQGMDRGHVVSAPFFRTEEGSQPETLSLHFLHGCCLTHRCCLIHCVSPTICSL